MDREERLALIEEAMRGKELDSSDAHSSDAPGDAASSSPLASLAAIDLPDPGDQPAWNELAQRFLPIYIQAASGELEITAQQRQILDKIMDRGFGKAGNEPEEVRDAGVVVLPTLYDDQEPVQVCPRCEAQLEGSDSDG